MGNLRKIQKKCIRKYKKRYADECKCLYQQECNGTDVRFQEDESNNKNGKEKTENVTQISVSDYNREARWLASRIEESVS